MPVMQLDGDDDGGVVWRDEDVPTEAISVGLPAHRVALYEVYQRLPETA